MATQDRNAIGNAAAAQTAPIWRSEYCGGWPRSAAFSSVVRAVNLSPAALDVMAVIADPFGRLVVMPNTTLWTRQGDVIEPREH
ncbi:MULTISPECIES: hypothetical protein [Pseudofrankia]|uniref:hypothetical protein n=1 Tax=Pseudofrankia TaxID=2994363 RepID=UPI0018E33A1E|nr:MULTISPECIES: hypothetical protein [Pseudofrankia]